MSRSNFTHIVGEKSLLLMSTQTLLLLLFYCTQNVARNEEMPSSSCLYPNTE